MKLHLKSSRLTAIATLIAAAAFAGASLHAQTAHTWMFTSAGTHSWNDPNSWFPSEGYPDSGGAIANVNIDIVGTQTIQLNEDITIGILNIGDADGSHAFTIASGSGLNTLIFNSGDIDTSAEINLGNIGELSQTISAPIRLDSPLRVNVGGVDATNAQRIVFNGAFETNDLPITFAGGVVGETQITFGSEVLSGGPTAVITNNSHGSMVFNGTQSGYTGRIVVNNSASGSNVAGLTIANSGSLASVGEIEINGYLSAGVTQNGGTAWVGNGSQIANPGQRLTENTITFNGGSLNAGGQPLVASETNREVRDDVSVFNFNSGYSAITASGSNVNGGSTRVLDVAEFQRSPGATLFVRSGALGSLTPSGTTFLIGNAADYLYGAEGEVGTTTKSIIPWIVAANANGSAQSSHTFATYDPDTGLRGLNSTELTNNILAGEEHNVATGNLASPVGTEIVTVNSLAHTTSGSSNIGAGKTLSVASGAISFQNNNGAIGAAGDASAGTLDFGSEEGVIWSNGSNINGIGASITGTDGLTKAGTGTLILTGVNNDYSGLTYVSGGILQVGNGVNFSNLGGSDEITIAVGAQLSLAGGNATNMILDTAVLRLEQYGLFNGKVTLFPEVNETVGALFLGEMQMPAGTYGPTGTGADFESDQWFGGLGVLTVVPEPGSAALLLGGIAMLVSRRRRG